MVYERMKEKYLLSQMHENIVQSPFGRGASKFGLC